MIKLAQKLTTGTEERPKQTIEADMFKPTGKSIGYGCWGQVDLYKDEGGNSWAIKYFSPNETGKRQMQERGWTEDHVMLNESVPLQATGESVAPRIVARDKKGKLYVAMPYYKEGDLSQKLRFLGTKEALEVTKDIARALKYIHQNKSSGEKDYFGKPIRGCAHGDVKPSNILIDKERAYLSDFGSSTCISIGGNGSERGPHGDVNYRAPECDGPNAEPSNRADVWSLGAILYEALTKEGIREGLDEINQKVINRKLRKVESRKVRKFLKKCLAYEPYSRFYSGEEALKGLENTIENLNTWKSLWKHARNWTLPLAIPIALVSLVTYGAYVHEPKKLDMPKTHRIEGILYAPEHEDKSSLEFVAENIVDLPDAPLPLGMMAHGLDKWSKNCTNNRVVAYLVKTHMQAALKKGIIPHDSASKKQGEIYFAYTTGDERRVDEVRSPTRAYPAVAKCVEVALQNSRIEGNKVDLEDVLAKSRVGVEKVEQAKRLSGSLNWEKYREAKDSKGSLIIPENERDFIDQWLSFYHVDVD